MKEDMPMLGRWIARAFQKYWRLVRGLSLSVEAFVIDEAERGLMVRNKSGAGWELPCGIVQKNENLETAARRILRNIAGIEVNGKPELLFFSARGANDQTGVFLVRDWHRLPAAEWCETRFFPLTSLSAGADAKTAERIRRCLEDRTTSEV